MSALVDFAAWTVCLPLLGAAAALATRRSLPRAARWFLALCLSATAALALFAIAPHALRPTEDALTWRSTTVGAAPAWLAWDSGVRDGRLDAKELGRPVPAEWDTNLDGALDLVELEAAAAARGAHWIALGAPGRRGSVWLGLGIGLDPTRGAALLALTLLLAGLAWTRAVRDTPTPGEGALALLAAALTAAIWSSSALLSVVAYLAGLLAAFALHQAGAGEGAPSRVGIGTILGLSLSAVAALSATFSASGAGHVSGLARWPLVLGLLLPALILPTRRGPAGAWAGGLIGSVACTLSAVALLVRLTPEGLFASAPVWGALALALALRAAAHAATGRVDRALSLALLAGQLLALCSWSLGAGAPSLALAGALALGGAVLVLASDAASATLGGFDLQGWCGLRRLHPRAALGLLLGGVALLALPGSPLARAAEGVARHLLQGGPLSRVLLALGAVVLFLVAWVALRVALRGVRGAPLGSPPGPPRGGQAALVLAAFALGLWGLQLQHVLPPPPWRAPSFPPLTLAQTVVGGVALALAWATTGVASIRGLEWILGIDVHLESYAPQRRLVQPFLGFARRCGRLQQRLAEDTLGAWLDRVSLALTRAARAPALADPLSPTDATDPEAPPSPLRAAMESGGLEAALFLTLLGALLAFAAQL